MIQKVTQSGIEEISGILHAPAKRFADSWQWQIRKSDNTKPLVLTVYDNAAISESKKGIIISVQTQHGFYELHDCSGYMIFEPDEVFFIKYDDEKISCLIIGRECTCSLYSGIQRSILHADFAKLEPAQLLSAMQLSITENLFT